ncbi:MAG TPA: VOC family protein [Puia sp.]|nr:VOC family protein [Puia sp.]
MKRVTSIGGIFFKCEDVERQKTWYERHLGLPMSPYGTTFEWVHADGSSKKGSTTWAPFAKNTKYFDPSAKEFMINYQVENLEWLVEQLKADGVTVIDAIEKSDYGSFVHILDPEGNKIELWEPAEKGGAEDCDDISK